MMENSSGNSTDKTIITIDINRNLLASTFESYRLSLDPLPILKQSVVGGVEEIGLGDEQYGYLHAQIFGVLNHLIPDPYANESVYYINSNRNIQWCRVLQDSRFSSQRSVWQIPQSESTSKSGNTSISFPHTEWAVVCNGSTGLFLLNTPSRAEGEPWQHCHSHQIEGIDPTSPSLVLHSMYNSFPSNNQIDCLLCYVSKVENFAAIKNQEKSTNIHFVCVLEWLTFSCPLGKESSNSWFMKRHRRLLGHSAPLYSNFEALTGMLITISEKPFRIIHDTDKPVQELNEDVALERGSEEQPKLYFFVQTNEDICVTFKVDIERRSDITATIKASSLQVRVKDKLILDGTLSNTVDVTNSTWTFNSNRLEIFLTKSVGGWWKNLLAECNERGQEVIDSALVEEVQQCLLDLTTLESEIVDTNRSLAAYDPQELEECDLSSYENLLLQRFDGDNHNVTHQANMGGYQWLFKIGPSNDQLSPFCTRYDVDGVVWQPSTNSEVNQAEKFQVEHVATHPALGYVLASKQDRRFITAAPDFSYATVCDTNRHVYVYRQPQNLPKDSLSLRNRRTGREVDRIAKQHVISLDQCDSILGLHANDRFIYVLSQTCLYAIKVNESPL